MTGFVESFLGVAWVGNPSLHHVQGAGATTEDYGLSTPVSPSPRSQHDAGESGGRVGLRRPHTGAGPTGVKPSLSGEPLLQEGEDNGRHDGRLGVTTTLCRLSGHWRLRCLLFVTIHQHTHCLRLEHFLKGALYASTTVETLATLFCNDHPESW